MSSYNTTFNNLGGFVDGCQLFAVAGALSAPTVLQVAKANTNIYWGTGATSLNIPFTLATTAGSYLLLIFGTNSNGVFYAPDTWNISDSLGDGYGQLQTQGLFGTSVSARTSAYLAGPIAGGANSARITWRRVASPSGAGNGIMCCSIIEISGATSSPLPLGSYAQANNGTTGGTGPLTVGPASASPPLLLIAAEYDGVHDAAGNATTVTGYTLFDTNDDTGGGSECLKLYLLATSGTGYYPVCCVMT